MFQKKESEVQAFLDKGKPYRKVYSVKHDLEGLGLLLEFLKRYLRNLLFHPLGIISPGTGKI
jgi:hypothetical protein